MIMWVFTFVVSTVTVYTNVHFTDFKFMLKIFSIWFAHALGSGIDSKNNKNPYTVICFSLHV
jgi:hypothetical protein